MHKYTVLAVLTIQPGVILGLTHAQAELRSHALKPLEVDNKLKMGDYEVLSPVQFKRGETIWTGIELSKAMAEQLEPEETTKSKAQAKKREEAAAKSQTELLAKAKAWDDVQPELEQLRAAVAKFDTTTLDALPEAVRKGTADAGAGADKK